MGRLKATVDFFILVENEFIKRVSEHRPRLNNHLTSLERSQLIISSYLLYDIQFRNEDQFLMCLDILTDQKALLATAKAVLFSCILTGGTGSYMTEPSSFKLLSISQAVRLFGHLGYSPLEFRGVHTATFYEVAQKRCFMTADLYLRSFLSKFADNLMQTRGSLEGLHFAILCSIALAIFRKTGNKPMCERIVNGITYANSDLIRPMRVLPPIKGASNHERGV